VVKLLPLIAGHLSLDVNGTNNLMKPCFPHGRTLALIPLSLVVALLTLHGCIELLAEMGEMGDSSPSAEVKTAPSTRLPTLSRVPLQPINVAKSNVACCQLESLGLDEQLGNNGEPGDKEALLKSIDYSLQSSLTS